jgi:hypothetical protein
VQCDVIDGVKGSEVDGEIADLHGVTHDH